MKKCLSSSDWTKWNYYDTSVGLPVITVTVLDAIVRNSVQLKVDSGKKHTSLTEGFFKKH